MNQIFIILFFLGTIGLQACNSNSNHFVGNDHSTKESNTPKIKKESNVDLIPIQKGDKWGFCNPDKEIVISCEYDWVNPFREELSRVSKDGKVGFINKKGIVVIDLKYDWAHDVFDGLIYAEISSEEWGNTGGFINTKGEEIIPFQIEMPPVPLPQNERHILSNGLIAVPWLEEPFQYAKYIYFNAKGEKIIETDFTYAMPFYEEMAAVQVSPYEKVGLIDKTGKLVFQGDYYQIGPFKEGRARVRKEEQMGFIDGTGKVVIPIIYSTFNDFSEGLVVISKDDKSGCLDRDGKEVIPFIYDKIFEFKEGLALALKDNKVGFINKKGEIAIPFDFDAIGDEYSFTSYPGITSFYHGFCLVWKNKKVGLINSKGETIIDFKYDDIVWDNFDLSTGLILVKEGEKQFYIDLQGNEY